MSNRRMLSNEPQDKIRNSETIMQFLVEKFEAEHCEHPFLDNLVTLNGETWLVVSSVSDTGVLVYEGNTYSKHEFIRELKKLNAGILIFQQLVDYQLCIYLIDEVILLKQFCGDDFFLDWEKVEYVKRFSEMGFVLDAELIGFKVLRRARFEALHSLPVIKMNSFNY